MSDLQFNEWEGFLPRGAIVMARRQADAEGMLLSALPAATPVLPELPLQTETQSGSPPESLVAIRDDLGDCRRCKLCEGRTTLVFGEGNPKAELMFVGEGPGENEDIQGRPFVGKAGELLDRMIQAIGLTRDQVYIANVVKCRPPGNRNPEPDEIAACGGFLSRQIDVIQPKVIVALGKFAVQTLLQTDEGITRLRGTFRSYRGAKLMPTFHPAYLLRNPSSKREAWQDLLQVARELGLEVKTRRE